MTTGLYPQIQCVKAIDSTLSTLRNALPPIPDDGPKPKQDMIKYQSREAASRFECLMCGKTFANKNLMFRHLASEGHAHLYISPLSQGDYFTCEHRGSEVAATSFVRALITGCSADTAKKLFASMNDAIDSTNFMFMLDSGETVLSLATMRCILATKGTPQKKEWRGICLEIARTWPHLIVGRTSKHVKRKKRGRSLWGFPKCQHCTSTSAPTSSTVQPGTCSCGLAMMDSPLIIAREVFDQGLVKGFLGIMHTHARASDTSIPLLHGLSHTNCEICLDTITMCCEVSISAGVGVIYLPCGHAMCPQSLAQWIDTQVSSSQLGIGEIKCPSYGCEYCLTLHEVYEYAPSSSVASRAERLIIEKVLGSMKDWVWCPRCESGGFKGKCPSDTALSAEGRFLDHQDADCKASTSKDECSSEQSNCTATSSGAEASFIKRANTASRYITSSLLQGRFLQLCERMQRLGLDDPRLVCIEAGEEEQKVVGCTSSRSEQLGESSSSIDASPDMRQDIGSSGLGTPHVSCETTSSIPACGGECHSYICNDCKHEWCTVCAVPASLHRGEGDRWLTCLEAQSTVWFNNNAKACPGCGVYTQRDGGCSHMTCKICMFEWCWLCNGKYQPGRYTFGNKCPCKNAPAEETG